MPKLFREQRLHGLPVSDGVTCAQVCLLNDLRHTTVSYERLAAPDLAHEKQRLQAALAAVARKLAGLAGDVGQRIGRAEGDIFAALQMMIEDPTLENAIITMLETSRCNAEAAVVTTFDAYAARLNALGEAYVSERANDFLNLKNHVLRALTGATELLQCDGHHQCERGRNRIVVARQLPPAALVALDLEGVCGIITERGGHTSHAAILARSVGIPMVSGVHDVADALSCGTEVLLDGSTGEIIIWPSEATRSQRCRARLDDAGRSERSTAIAGFEVLANIATADDATDALRFGAEGIGLYRTEYEFIHAGALLDEDAQYERYRRVVERMRGKPVYVRLLDIGGDKELPFLDVPREANPFLGCRGVRFLLTHPELLKTQARALARAGQHGPLGIMYPMLGDAAQFVRLRGLINEAIADLPHVSLRHGALFEVPAAGMEADEIMREADFGSIGTNDLLQYLCAVDRTNDSVANEYTADRPAFWSLLRGIVRAAAAAGKPLSVCGELAGDPHYTSRLLEIGIRSVSVSPRLIARVRAAAQQHLHTGSAVPAQVQS